MSKINDLNINIFGCKGWSFNGEDEDVFALRTSDILICDYASLLDLLGRHLPHKKDSSPFSSLILDLRHPAADGCHTDTTSEVESVKWWKTLNKFALRFSGMKRLVIEHFDLPQNKFLPVEISSDTKDRHVDEILAMKVAFAYNPSVFFSEHATIGKRVVKWVKSQGASDYIGGEKCFPDQLTLSNDGFSPSLTHRSILQASLRSIYESAVQSVDEGSALEDDDTAHALSWEIRMCSLTPLQIVSYEKCCLGVLGSVTHRDDASDSLQAIAESMIKLRKVCFHSNLDEVISYLLTPIRQKMSYICAKGVMGSSLLAGTSSFSEPNIEAAKAVVEKSAKMKELLAVLTNECGCDVAHEIVRGPSESTKILSATLQPQQKRRVLILATLVEAQLLTSFLLSSIGLRHELLVSGTLSGDVTLNSRIGAENVAAWAWSQTVLSRFNNDDASEVDADYQSCDIVIASPSSVSSQSSGISAVSADVIVSIDEDWSGREALHVVSILKKIRRNESSSDAISSCKFIKIVCQDTCEDSVLCRGNTITVDATADETKSDVKEPRKRSKGKRKFSRERQSSRASKATQDDTEGVIEMNGFSNSVNSQTLFCPIVLKWEGEALANRGGYLVPSEKLLLGSNVLRYKNKPLSVFLGESGSRSSESGPVFMATDKYDGHDRSFGWALFNAEHRASSLTTMMYRSSAFSNRVIEMKPITLDPYKAVLGVHNRRMLGRQIVSAAPVRHYVESFGRTSSATYDVSNFLLCDQGDEQTAIDGTVASIDAVVGDATCCDIDLGVEGTANESETSLLVYDLPLSKSDLLDLIVGKKRKEGDVEYVLEGKRKRHGGLQMSHSIRNDYPLRQSSSATDLARSGFSLCFAASKNTSSSIVRDGNQGGEPLVYFPSFLPSLLQIIQNVVHYPTSPQSGTKRKSTGEDSGVSEKRRKSITLSENHYSSDMSALPDHFGYSGAAGSALIDEFIEYDLLASNTETNPYSFWNGTRSSGSAETDFTKTLISFDIDRAASCQRWPSVDAMIVVTQKESNNNDTSEAGSFSTSVGAMTQNKPAKKNKHHKRSSSVQDPSTTTYFGKGFLLDRSLAVREGVKISVASSLLGSVRLRFRLNDLVSDSFIVHLPRSMNHFHSSSSGVKFGPFQSGTVARHNVSRLAQRDRNRSGVSLPMGVKRPRLAKKLSSSLEETSEQWTDIEDILLKESVARYGMNWELASQSVSVDGASMPSFLSKKSTSGKCRILKSRRSPTQCRHRWESLMHRGSTNLNISNSFVTSSSHSTKEVRRFQNESEDQDKEFLVYDASSSTSHLKHQRRDDQSNSMHWIGHPASSPDESTDNDDKQLIMARIKRLKETSKKRHGLPITIPGSKTTGDNTTVQLVPVHASHADSVQAARASWTSSVNGIAPPRNDMWPMEILDYAKQRAAAASSQGNTNANIHHQRGSVAPYSHPPQPSYQPPHNVHPAHHAARVAALGMNKGGQMQGVPPHMHPQQGYHLGMPHPAYGMYHQGPPQQQKPPQYYPPNGGKPNSPS